MKFLSTIVLAFFITMAFAQTASLSGSVSCTSGNPMGAMSINILGTDGTDIDVMTLADGTFTVLDLPTGVDYTLSVTDPMPNSALNGVSTFDLVLIMRHILGVQPFTDAEDYIAADVNGSGAITTLDMVQMRMLILGIITDLPQGAWAFVNENCLATVPPVNCGLNVANLQSSGATIDIVGVKLGDVNDTVVCQ